MRRRDYRAAAELRGIRLEGRGSAQPLPAALEAIAVADLITLGPGSLYTSVIPNLLVAGIPDAIRQSKAVKAYFVNLMWQPGETDGLQRLRAISVPICEPSRRRWPDRLRSSEYRPHPIRAPLLQKYAASKRVDPGRGRFRSALSGM